MKNLNSSSTIITRGVNIAYNQIKQSAQSSSNKIQTVLQPHHQRVTLNSSKLFSSYEYPLRNEAPIITRTVAGTAITSTDNTSTSTSTNISNNDVNKHSATKSSLSTSSSSPFIQSFDEHNTISTQERQSILANQSQSINTKLSPLCSHPISNQVPSFIPPNLPSSTMHTPQTLLTTLDNGIRVASQETYGQVSTFGVLSNCGSRLENHQTTGVNHLLELLAFNGTTAQSNNNDDTTTIQQQLSSLGGISFASSSKEQFLYCIDVLRPNVKPSFELLKNVILYPKMEEEDVEDVKRIIEFQWMDIPPEIKLGEGLHIAAYQKKKKGGGQDGDDDDDLQQLGRPHFCPLEALPNLNCEIVRNFRNLHLLNPKGLVIAGAGIEHDELVSLANQHFGHLTALEQPSSVNPNEATTDTNAIIPSQYTGGEYKETLTTIDGFTRIALAFPTGGWHSDDLVPACILQTLLGGGSSFSAGGPGKGMYSRLYRQVLNRYYWAESCESFTSFHTETGLFGISGSCNGDKSLDLTSVLAEHFMKLAIDLVEDEEFDRAVNMLKCNVLTQLESRLVLFEDVGRQILTYGKREGTKEMCDKIDAVTKEDLRRIVRKALGVDENFGGKRNAPTLSAVGDNLEKCPSQEEVARWFQ